MSEVTKVTYEADVQRQYVRVPLPAKIEINNHTYDAKDWSVAGVCIKLNDGNKAEKNLQEGKVYKAVLFFDLDSFSLNVPLSVEVCHGEGTKDSLGLQFVDMNAQKTSIMQQLVGAYVSGELINVNDLIHIVSRDNTSRPRNIPKLEGKQKLYQAILQNFSWVLVAIASLFLFSFIATGIYEKAYIVSANTAMVSASVVAVKSPSGGNIAYKSLRAGDKVSQGDVLLTVSSASGEIYGVDSPCDCVVRERLASVTDIIRKNQPLMTLTAIDAEPFIEAMFSYSEATSIKKGDKAHLNFPGEDVTAIAVVEVIQMKKGSNALVRVLLKPETILPVSLVGRPVNVKIDKLGLFVK